MSYGSQGDRMFKIVLIGDVAVGKTSLRRNYLGQRFRTSHIATLGVDFAQRYVQLDGVTSRVVVWDLAGDHSYENVRKHYYAGANGIVLVYSVVDRTSFENTSRWLLEAFKYIDRLPPTAIIGNKTDLRDEASPSSVVTTAEGLELVEFYKHKKNLTPIFKETSALTGFNVLQAFDELVRSMMQE
jgi:small GTP-binding protein